MITKIDDNSITFYVGRALKFPIQKTNPTIVSTKKVRGFLITYLYNDYTLVQPLFHLLNNL